MSVHAFVEKRRLDRAAVRVEAECDGYSSRIRAQISDMSIYGAYVDTINPFPIGADLEMKFPGRDVGSFIQVRGVVRHSRPGMGMGIEFIGVDDLITEEIERIFSRQVLVADDDETYRTFLRLYFEKHGFKVKLAKDGQEAQRLVKQQAFDLVITDGLMPHMHGFELSRFIKSMPEHRRPKVIVMTAIYRSELYRLEATIKYQADGYLRKPFKIEDLTQCIQSLLLDETQ